MHQSNKFKTQKSSGGDPGDCGRAFTKERRRMTKAERHQTKKRIKSLDDEFMDGVTSIFSIGWGFY